MGPQGGRQLPWPHRNQPSPALRTIPRRRQIAPPHPRSIRPMEQLGNLHVTNLPDGPAPHARVPALPRYPGAATVSRVTTKSDWACFFDAHAPEYMKNGFTRHTAAEVNFLVQHLELRPGMRILDVGCGTGRHSVELARRGFDMTGVDLSEAMLAEARKAAESAGVRCQFIQCDAAHYHPDRSYDAAICLCEGAFCLVGQGDDPIGRDLAILRNIAEALLPGGRFMLTALNAARLIRGHDKPGFHGQFDLRTLIETGDLETGPAGHAVRITSRQRHYFATELDARESALRVRAIRRQMRDCASAFPR